MKKTAELNLESHFSYPVWAGMNALDDIKDQIAERFGTDRLAVVVDQNVHRLHGDWLQDELKIYFDRIMEYIVPAGEQSKSIEQWQAICNYLLEKQIRRSTPLLAVGGGVTGDLAGFAAATVLRGVPLIHLPTTLLAMVDSSIGGKTGINHQTGKNLIGSFYQPAAVYADLAFLETLEYREWVNGLSEILKYGAISDFQLFHDCEKLADNDTFQNVSDWLETIGKSVRIKAEIVKEDTRESGVRAYLNFGHTFAHALESYTDYGRYSHGEAVFLGMHAALYASSVAGADLDYSQLQRFNDLYDIDVSGLDACTDELINHMYYDKKVQRDTIRLVLLQEWEHPYVTEWVDHELLRDSWRYAISQFE